MASSSIHTKLTVLDISYIAPCVESSESAESEFFVPLTFFDTMWLKIPPVQRNFFYGFEGLTPNIFNSEILPRLKHSLSLILSRFMPLAGNLTWPDNTTKPIILCSQNDAVLVIVAESNVDFGLVSSRNVRDAALSHLYIPELPVSDSKASVIALQLTLFPNQGFCIGISSLHAVLDGKSTALFMKAWAYICKHSENSLPPELTPFVDREVIKDPERLDMEFLKMWLGVKLPDLDTNNPRSLKLLPSTITTSDLVRATFVLSSEDVRKLRDIVVSYLAEVHNEDESSVHLSTFVLAFAYTAVCVAKAKATENKVKAFFMFAADCRQRLHPQIHENYFGNCVASRTMYDEVDTKSTVLKNIVSIAMKLSELIKGLDEGIIRGIKEQVARIFEKKVDNKIRIAVAGSTKFGLYGTDFGWGRPVMVEITSIDRIGAISMAESREGHGGVEIGVVLTKHEMDKFASLFVDGIKDQ